MDTVTQMLLGAAVGHATLGRRVGRKALVWGALLGLAPDLDVLIPQPDAVSAVTEHRGFSHSVIVHTAVAPALGALGARLHRGDGIGVGGWTLLAWLALVTHALLDALTVYGTQLFWPWTGPPVGLGSIFIIDPLYSLPLLAAVLWAATRRRVETGWRACVAALALSTGYLAAGVGLQQHVRAVALESAAAGGLEVERMLVTPTAFNIVLWRVLAMAEGGYAEGYHSLVDPRRPIRFDWHASDRSPPGALGEHPSVQRLRWFTKGFQRVSERAGEIVITDLRMGFEPKYVFSFVVGRREGDAVVAVTSRPGPVEQPTLRDMDVVWSRLLGR